MDGSAGAGEMPRIQRCASVLWPSFLVAGVATAAFFMWFDPIDLLHCSGRLRDCRLGAYTGGFFLFWLTTFASSALTCWFRRPCGGGRRD